MIEKLIAMLGLLVVCILMAYFMFETVAKAAMLLFGGVAFLLAVGGAIVLLIAHMFSRRNYRPYQPQYFVNAGGKGLSTPAYQQIEVDSSPQYQIEGPTVADSDGWTVTVED